MFPFYCELRSETKIAKTIRIKVNGSNWGLACNTIHMLDLLSFLSGFTEFSLDTTFLEDKIYDMKRKGFIELGGRLLPGTSRGDTLELLENRKQENSSVIEIEFEGKLLEADKSAGCVRKYYPDSF